MESRGDRSADTSGLQRCARCGAGLPSNSNFCPRCGRTRAHDAPSSDADESSGVDPVTSDRRRQPRLASAFERRQLTVLFCDLVDSTSLASQVDPEDLNDAIERFYNAVTSATREFDGYVARFIGDGVLVYFGFPEAHENDAERAIHTALSALRRVRALRVGSTELRARVGVATGVVVVGNLHASTTSMSPDIAGEAAHVAARLQSTAEPDTVVVAGSTRHIVGDLFDWQSLGTRHLKGLPKPVEVWAVGGTRNIVDRYEAQRGPPSTPMLARDDHRITLQARWSDARGGKGSTVFVSGEAGIGKSRLAASVINDIDPDTGVVLRFSCAPHRQRSTLHPAIAYLEQSAGIERTHGNDERVERLTSLLAGTPEGDLALIGELLDLQGAGRPSRPSLSPQARRQRTLAALLDLIERLSAKKPLLLLFEDVQWSDATSLTLLDSLVARVPKLPILLLVLGRPEFVPNWPEGADNIRIELAPLSADVSAALVHFITASRPLPPRVVAHIVRKTDGLPLFIEEVTRAVLESGGPLRAQASSLESSVLPLSLHASLLSRLDRLGKAREIAEVASAIGREFTQDLLAKVVDHPESLETTLDVLVESGLVVRATNIRDAYAFKHALIRDAAHSIMIREKRHLVHRRIATALEQDDPDAARHLPEILAWHYTEAGVADRAVAYWLRAGQQSLRRSAMTEALSQLRRGEELIHEVPDSPQRHQTELDLTIAIGMAQIATQGYAILGTKATFEKAQGLCHRLADPPQTLAVMHGLWTHSLLRGEFDDAIRLAGEVLARGEARNDPMWQLMGRRFQGVTAHPMGRFDDACEQLDLGLERYDPTLRQTYSALTVDDPRVVMLIYRSWSLMCLGRFDEALRCSETAIEEATDMGHAYTMAHAFNGAAFVAMTIGTYDLALQRLDALDAVLVDNGIAYYEAVSMVFRGYCLAAKGDYATALPLLVDGMRRYRLTGTILYLPGFLRMSAEAHCWAGCAEAAHALVGESMAFVETSRQCWDFAELYRVRGQVARGFEDRVGAERSFREALAHARQRHARLWELRAAHDLAALLIDRGDVDEARELLRPLMSASNDGAAVPAVVAVARLLASID